MKCIIRFLFMLLPVAVAAQPDSTNPAGTLTLGIRSTLSAFSDEPTLVGTGGHFRIRLSEKVNTEWFADYITGAAGPLAKRTDAHIGWSVMLYPVEKWRRFMPYVSGGHCFDYTKVSKQEIFTPAGQASRWSSAVHLGAGSHFFLNEKFDLTIALQQMIHIGRDIEAVTENGDVTINEGDLGLEGHLFLSFSVNYNIADLWK